MSALQATLGPSRNVLNLVLMASDLRTLLENERVSRHLGLGHTEIHAEFTKLAETRGLADAPQGKASDAERAQRGGGGPKKGPRGSPLPPRRTHAPGGAAAPGSSVRLAEQRLCPPPRLFGPRLQLPEPPRDQLEHAPQVAEGVIVHPSQVRLS